MRRLALLAAAVVIALAAAWVWLRKADQPAKPIWFIPKTTDTGIQFWQVVKEGVAAAAKEYGMDFSMLGTDTESDVDGQIRLLEKAIDTKPGAVLLAATDYEKIVPIAKRVVEAGVPLITVDSGIKGGISASLIATDNYAAGVKVGEALAKVLPQKGDVAVVSFIQGSYPAIERENGVRDLLGKEGGFRIIGTYYCDGSADRAYDITKRILRDNSGLQGIAGLNEPSTIGVAKAVKEAGLGGRVKLIGFDNSSEEIDMMEEGVIQAIVVQKPFNMGYLAAKAAMRLKRGDRLESRIDTGSEVIWKETIYDKENQKLLFPFLSSTSK